MSVLGTNVSLAICESTVWAVAGRTPAIANRDAESQRTRTNDDGKPNCDNAKATLLNGPLWTVIHKEELRRRIYPAPAKVISICSRTPYAETVVSYIYLVYRLLRGG